MLLFTGLDLPRWLAGQCCSTSRSYKAQGGEMVRGEEGARIIKTCVFASLVVATNNNNNKIQRNKHPPQKQNNNNKNKQKTHGGLKGAPERHFKCETCSASDHTQSHSTDRGLRFALLCQTSPIWCTPDHIQKWSSIY